MIEPFEHVYYLVAPSGERGWRVWLFSVHSDDLGFTTFVAEFAIEDEARTYLKDRRAREQAQVEAGSKGASAERVPTQPGDATDPALSPPEPASEQASEQEAPRG